MYSFPVVKKENTLYGGADLHLHTQFSDGTYTPESLIKTAVLLNFTTISITDHDTISGVEQGVSLGMEHSIEVIPGIELSCSELKDEIHILGYFIDYKNIELKRLLNGIHLKRKERMGLMIDKLISCGLNINKNDFFNSFSGEAVGRLHIAKYLVKNGIVGSTNEVFQKYIGDNKPAFLNVNCLTLEEGISLISKYGGVPVFAHPGLTQKDDLIERMVLGGLKGIEVYHAVHSGSQVTKYLELAKKYNLVATGGSDCHGFNKTEMIFGKVRLSEENLNNLKSLKKACP